MKCPSCGAPTADGAVICNNCDYVLDPAFFTAAGPDADERTETPQDVARSEAPPAPVTPKAPPAEPRPAVPALRGPATVVPTMKAPPPTVVLEELWTELRRVGKELETPDRLAFFGALTQLVWAFLPWKDTARDGAVVGLMTVGAMTLLGAGLVVTAMLLRHRRWMPSLDPLVPWLVQVAGAGAMVFTCLFAIRASWDGRTVAGYESLQVPVSIPSFGAYIALLSAMLSLAGTIWALRKKLT